MYPIDNKLFFARYEKKFRENLTIEQTAYLATLLELIKGDHKVEDPRWISYMLATVVYECGRNWKPTSEKGSAAYFIRRYWRNEKVRNQLGNLSEADAIRFRGRGYVQITGRRNYDFMGSKIGIDLVASQQKALDPPIAYAIMSIGMRHGYFTGKKLADYIEGRKCEYVEARRIINGTDNAELIADYAIKFEKILKA